MTNTNKLIGIAVRFDGDGHGIFAVGTEPDKTAFYYLEKGESPKHLTTYKLALGSGWMRNVVNTFFNLYCTKEHTMTEPVERYTEIANYENVAIGYIEMEPEGKEDKSYYNDYLIISIKSGVAREGSVGFDKDGNPYCKIAGRRAKKFKTIEAAHQHMVDHLYARIVSDALDS